MKKFEMKFGGEVAEFVDTVDFLNGILPPLAKRLSRIQGN